MKFKELKVGDTNVELLALVVDCKVKQTVNGTPYYGLTISDGEDNADARIWSVSLASNLASGEIENGNIYKITVKVNDYAGKNQIIINKIEDVDLSTIDVTTFFKTAPVDIQIIKDKIYDKINGIKNPIIKKIVEDLLLPRMDGFLMHQAAVVMHHNYLGGLAYHVYSMLNISEKVLENYPALNPDLLTAGILIHDLGKMEEITSDKSPSYSKEGNLLGHIVIGLRLLDEVVRANGFSGTEEALALEHMIIAHHGELEYGSPKEPLIMEAHALYLIDYMDAKLAGANDFVAKTPKGSSTSPIPSLGKKVLYVPKIK